MDLKTLLGDAFKDNMTLADIDALLKDKNLVDPSTLAPSVPKADFDKAAHELAEAKKKLKEKMTDDETAAAQQKEIQEQLNNLQKENSQMKFEKQFLSGGYDPKTAASLAEAMANGDMKKFTEVHFAYAKQHETELQAKIKADLLAQTPRLQTTNPNPNGELSIGEKMAQAYNAQFAPANPATGAPQGK
jgi:hypothetical protein